MALFGWLLLFLIIYSGRENMKANKYVKGCLVFLGVITLLVVLLVGWFWWSMENNKKRAREDSGKYSAICDTITVITEKPGLALVHFRNAEIDQLKFYIVRNNKIVKDTIVNYKIAPGENYLHTEIPFVVFLKTDTIIVETKHNSKRFYQVTGFHHYAYLHYGMFGYLGSHECRLADNNYLVNGEQNDGTLLKEEGMKEYILPEKKNK